MPTGLSEENCSPTAQPPSRAEETQPCLLSGCPGFSLSLGILVVAGPLLPAYFLFSTTVTRGKRFCLNRVPLGSRFAAFLASVLFICHLLPPGTLCQTSPLNWVYYWAFSLGSPSRGLGPNRVRGVMCPKNLVPRPDFPGEACAGGCKCAGVPAPPAIPSSSWPHALAAAASPAAVQSSPVPSVPSQQPLPAPSTSASPVPGHASC